MSGTLAQDHEAGAQVTPEEYSEQFERIIKHLDYATEEDRVVAEKFLRDMALRSRACKEFRIPQNPVAL